MKLQSVILQMKVREKYFFVLLFKHKQCSHITQMSAQRQAPLTNYKWKLKRKEYRACMYDWIA